MINCFPTRCCPAVEWFISNSLNSVRVIVSITHLISRVLESSKYFFTIVFLHLHHNSCWCLSRSLCDWFKRWYDPRLLLLNKQPKSIWCNVRIILFDFPRGAVTLFLICRPFMKERAPLVCRGSNVCPANGVCAQTQENVMESAVGNERALASSVTCTAEAPVALPVYNKLCSLCSLHFSLIPSILLSAFFLPLLFICLFRLFVSCLAFCLPPFHSLSLSLPQSLSSVYGERKSSLYK